MKGPTRSKRLTLFLLSATLLFGMGLSYSQRHHPPFSLQVLSPEEEKLEKAFEASRQVSLRKGTEEDFRRLPHVGPALARRIVDFRERHGFRTKEDILKVKGIGAKTYDAVKDLILLE